MLKLLQIVLFALCLTGASKPKKEVKIHEVTFDNQLIDGKKVWTPAEVRVKAGERLKVKIVNTLAEPHGFEIPGIQGAMIIGVNETKNIEFTATQKGSYEVKCHMHPAHVGAKLIIE
jgi:plastocyanin